MDVFPLSMLKQGVGEAATRHFIWQRATGAANIVFTGFLVWMVVRLARADRAEMVLVLANPFIALVMAMMIVSVAIHMRIGLREVIEDYIDEPRANRLCRMLNTLFTLGMAIAGLLAIAKIAFWE